MLFRRFRGFCGRIAFSAAALGAAMALAGCSALLPDARTETQNGWNSYQQAKADIDRIVPYRTTRADLVKMGLEPVKNPAITILTYSEILQRFAAGTAVRRDDFDPGIRQCLEAGKRCTAYSINVRRLKRDRIGNFWLDMLNFRRETDVTGWTFNGLVILVDDTVVYTLYGGQPNIHEHELVRNPLGPLQFVGEHAPNPLHVP